MNRDERPYGCTYPNCNETFFEKLDWRRHENTQHLQEEAWRCDEERPEGGACAKVCGSRWTFQHHLKKEHHVSDIEGKSETCRIGRNCQVRFWCGFCVKTIDLKKKGLDAWGERFGHISDHFSGLNGFKQQNIQDWILLDGSRKHALLSSAEAFGLSSPSQENKIEQGYDQSGKGSEANFHKDSHAIDPQEGYNVLVDFGDELETPAHEINRNSVLEATSANVAIREEEQSDLDSDVELHSLIIKASARSQDRQGIIIWSLYDKCRLALAECATKVIQYPGNFNEGSAKILKLSSESLFLWGESIKTSDLDVLTKWSYDLREAILQFLIDICQGLIQGIFPRISDVAGSQIQQELTKLSATVMNEMGCYFLSDVDKAQQSDDEGQHEDEVEIGKDEDAEDADDADGFILDIHNTIQCLMDLAPSIEQVLQHKPV